MKEKNLPRKIRISYSLLQSWERGDKESVVEMYYHLNQPTNRAMEEGRNIHKNIENFINKNKKFPSWLFNASLKAPLCENSFTCDYSDYFDLKVIIDCLDSPNIYEFKTGKQNSMSWARTYQIPIYFLACEMQGIKIEKAFLIHYNQHDKTRDWTLVWNTKSARKKAREYIDKIAPEIYQFFQKEGLI